MTNPHWTCCNSTDPKMDVIKKAIKSEYMYGVVHVHVHVYINNNGTWLLQLFVKVF